MELHNKLRDGGDVKEIIWAIAVICTIIDDTKVRLSIPIEPTIKPAFLVSFKIIDTYHIITDGERFTYADWPDDGEFATRLVFSNESWWHCAFAPSRQQVHKAIKSLVNNYNL